MLTAFTMEAKQVDSGWYKAIVSALQGHPDALLAFAMGLLMLALLAAGVNEWLGCGLPALLYIAYCLRSCRADRSKELLAETRVREMEDKHAKIVAERKLKRLSRDER